MTGKKSILNKKIKSKALVLLLVYTLLYTQLKAQNFIKSNEWKKYKREFYFGIGAANFLGDLGGLDRIGTDFSPVDLELKQTGFSAGMGYKYKLAKWINVSIGANYLKVRGDDKLTADIYRNNRNLNFKSNVFELLGRLELVYMHNRVGNRYGIKKTMSSRMRTGAYDLAAFIGFGGFYFNPKGKDVNGNWIKLRPLHTEGQGLPGGPKQYKNYSVCILMGIAYRYYIQRVWSVGLEFSFRKTFTDYIDDVSTVYHNKVLLQQAYGNKSVEMADPSLGKIYGATSPDASGKGAQRGDLNKDSYMSVQLTVGYLIKKKYKRRRSRLTTKF